MKKIIFMALFLVGMVMSTNAETNFNGLINETDTSELPQVCVTREVTTLVYTWEDGILVTDVLIYMSTTCVPCQ